MNTQQLRLIAIVVAVLVALWGASEMLSRRSDTTTATFALPRVSATGVDTVTIWRGGDSVTLIRHGTTWLVNGYPAASSAVGELFDALGDTAKPELAAESPSSFVRMGVDSAGAYLLRVVTGGSARIGVFVGGPAGDATYLRIPGSTNVYLWPGRLGALAARHVDDWRDRAIVSVTPDSVGQVEIMRARNRIALRRKGTHWSFASSAPADSAAVVRFLEHFRALAAAGFATPRQADSLRFDHPRRSVTLRSTSGGDLAALALDSAPGGFFVRAATGGSVYRLDFWQADALTPLAPALGAPSPPAPPTPKPKAKPPGKPTTH